MALQAIIAGVGLAAAAVGALKSNKAANKQASLSAQQDEISAAVSSQQRKIEQIRGQQAELDRLRTERNIIRQSQVARATALSRSSNQGGQFSSAFSGAVGNIQQDTGSALTALQGNFGLGQQVFDANARIAALGGQFNSLSSQIQTQQAKQDFGKTLFSTGLSIAGNAQTIANTTRDFGGLFTARPTP